MFTGFTSTSLDKRVALEFAFQGSKNKEEGKVPVLFKFSFAHNEGYSVAFLHSKEISSFPEEQEFLIGGRSLKVNKIHKERLVFRGKPMEVTVILLKG